ncbi:unnamed protein product [Candida verbasci]|uniref:Ammonia transport outward protein 2 n=1 Tax=Candida verbasci TaxID=1227364 RepID=A0A9W4TQC5_9ASCO|nr:unnamed protein product [Candida verbasci]
MASESESIVSKVYCSQNLENDSIPIGKVQTTGDGNEFVIIDNKKYYRHELLSAFAGTFEPGLHPQNPHKFGNAAALGLASFSVSSLVFNLYGLNAKNIHIPNVAISLAIFYAGTMQFLAGIWEGVCGNTFGMTALITYGSFYLSYGAIFIESFGITTAYMTKDPLQMKSAVGFFFMGFAIFSFLMLLCLLKSELSFVILFVFIFFTFLLQGAGYLADKESVIKAGCVFGCLVSLVGGWCAFQGIATPTNTYIESLN